jgi:peptidoglycan/LPS O-acetylase OafA/YrhL
MVMAYHGGHEIAVGAHLGVTVFFVLSGFLITSLLLDEARVSGRIDLRGFYRRRVARLAPALGVVLLVEVAWTLTSGDSSRWHVAVVGLLSTLTSTANLVMVVFGPAQAGDGFGWAWSLSLEEQFYLAWVPYLVFGIRRGWSTARLAAPAVALLVLSVLIRVRVSRPDGGKLIHAFFGTDTRMDALFAGCLLAFVVSRIDVPRPVRWAGLPALATLALAARYGGETLESTYTVVMPAVILATVALIASSLADPSIATTRLLSNSFLVRLGQVSYGLYLWNVLVRDFVASAIGDDPWELPAAAIAGWLVLTLVIAEVSMRYLELPVRRRFSGRRASSTPVAKVPTQTP